MSTDPKARLAELYAEAFRRFGAACLWSKQPVPDPGVDHARIVARALRTEGGREAYALARRIEEACDAVDIAAA
jgi:hypothetical protein